MQAAVNARSAGTRTEPIKCSVIRTDSLFFDIKPQPVTWERSNWDREAPMARFAIFEAEIVIGVSVVSNIYLCLLNRKCKKPVNPSLLKPRKP